MSGILKNFRSSPVSAPLRFIKSFHIKSEKASAVIKKYCPENASKKLLADLLKGTPSL